MKKIKQLIARAKSLNGKVNEELREVLWELVLYSPKVPVRLHQQQLLDEAVKFSLKVEDRHLSYKVLTFNGFKWGRGSRLILLTHGWASKAADFSELITALLQLEEVTVIAFDAPGNGSSEGDLSHLLLYIESLKAIIKTYGTPDVLIGHSLGVIANVMLLKEFEGIALPLLISLAPLIRLQENFIASMDAVDAGTDGKKAFMDKFMTHFNRPPSDLNMNHIYNLDGQLKHWLAYDEKDHIAPYAYLKDFLIDHPSIDAQPYQNLGHEKLLRDPEVIARVRAQVESVLFV
ncbi:alpha/beta hydrolase [Pedobacter sp. L105]|uniref:alpha/beta hydrolase n=1 Tax=Pedobacter sp. L105 TaxID=1641871 RepID=UPI00131C6E46|nr:alpha/beta hydrolase [Pedobacter sp. L105]